MHLTLTFYLMVEHSSEYSRNIDEGKGRMGFLRQRSKFRVPILDFLDHFDHKIHISLRTNLTSFTKLITTINQHF
jgi:hypothetical protein